MKPTKLDRNRPVTEYRVKDSADATTERNELNRILRDIGSRLDTLGSSSGNGQPTSFSLQANASQFNLFSQNGAYQLSLAAGGVTATEINFSTFDSDDITEGSTNLYFTDERAQDAVGGMVNSTLTYVDGTPSLGINLTNANTWSATQTFSRVDTPIVRATSSAGILIESNNGTDVADFGAGGGSNATFFGGVDIDGQTRLATSLTGYAKLASGVVSAQTGVPYTDLTSIPQAIDAIDNLTPAADRLAYYTGASTAALTTFTSFARDLLDDADASTMRSTLGLGTMATQAAADYVTVATTQTVSGAKTFSAASTHAGLLLSSTSSPGDNSIWNNAGSQLYRATAHAFRNSANSVTFLTLDSTGAAITGTASASSFTASTGTPGFLVSNQGTAGARAQFVNTGGTLFVGLDSSVGGLAGPYTANIWHTGNYDVAIASNNAVVARFSSAGLTLTGNQTTIAGSGSAGHIIRAQFPWVVFQNVAGTRMGYVQHDAADLVLNNDLSGRVLLRPNNTTIGVFSSSGLSITGALNVSGTSTLQAVTATTLSTTSAISVGGNIHGGNTVFGTSLSPGQSLLSHAASSPVSVRFQFGGDATGWEYRIARNNAGTVTDLFRFTDLGDFIVARNATVSGNATLGASTSNTHTVNGFLDTRPAGNGLMLRLLETTSGSSRRIQFSNSGTTNRIESTTGSGSTTLELAVDTVVVATLSGLSGGSFAVTGALSCTGNATFGDAIGDSHTINGAVTITGAATFNSNPAGRVTSGTYTPTITNVTNVSSSTAHVCQYMRVGEVVTVSGKVTIDPTSSGVDTVWQISLPITSSFTIAEQAGGGGGDLTGANALVAYADTTNPRINMYYIPSNSSSQFVFFTVTYRIV